MLRFDDCICGTSTIGTGTLTLAAPPAAFGGIDPDVWARATGIGNSAAFFVDYTITEYTDATNLKEKQKEAGTGTLTLGASSGIANCTLARTTIDWTATSLDVQPASVSVKPGTGITVGTAANVLVMIAPRAESVLARQPYYDTSVGDNAGIGCPRPAGTAGGAFAMPASGTSFFWIDEWPIGRAVTQASLRIQAAAGAGASTCSIAIFQINSSGKPGKRLVNFGDTGSLANTAGTINTSAALGTAVWVNPGWYYFGILPTYASGTPTVRAYGGTSLPSTIGLMGTSLLQPVQNATNASGDLNDPPTTSGWAISAGAAIPWFTFK